MPNVTLREYEPSPVAAPTDQTESALRAAVATAIADLERYTGRSFDQGRSVSTNYPDDVWDDMFKDDQQKWALEKAVGKHQAEFRFEKEDGDIVTYKHASGERIHIDSNSDFYQVQDGKEPTLTTRAEVLRAYQEIPSEVTATASPELLKKWAPLEKEVGFTGADLFSHYSTRGDVEVYITRVEERKRLIGIDDNGQFHDVNKEGHGGIISREEALAQVGMQPSFYTPGERTLREVVGYERIPDLARLDKTDDIQTYQHATTGGTVHIDSEGKFYNPAREVISRDEALSTLDQGGGNNLRPIAVARDHVPAGPSEAEGIPHQVAPELTTNRGSVQPAATEQSISM